MTKDYCERADCFIEHPHGHITTVHDDFEAKYRNRITELERELAERDERIRQLNGVVMDYVSPETLSAIVDPLEERILELEQQLADLGPWTVKDLRQYAEDTVADFRSLRERLAEAEELMRALLAQVATYPSGSRLIREYFTKHEKP